MKPSSNKIAAICSAVLMLAACQDKYSLNTSFTAPDQLTSPESVTLDVTSGPPITLSWSGNGAEDGGIVLYEVLFDKENGDFSSPLHSMPSDLGAGSVLTITQASLNTIARDAGIHPEGTGKIKWTVTASKGGIVKRAAVSATISVTRGEGIDNIPKELYLYGTATENGGEEGIPFRRVEEGVFQVYTTLANGYVLFKSGKNDDSSTYFADETGKLKEGSGTYDVTSSDKVVRLTVNYNTLSVTMSEVAKNVRCIWGATYSDITVLTYAGDGKFVGDGDILFIDPNKPETNPPSWLTWIEDRYYFIATVNGREVCWGRGDDVSAERPVGGEPASFYALHEFAWSQWDHLWKMSESLDGTHATITIDTNTEGLMIHTFTNISSL